MDETPIAPFVPLGADIFGSGTTSRSGGFYIANDAGQLVAEFNVTEFDFEEEVSLSGAAGDDFLVAYPHVESRLFGGPGRDTFTLVGGPESTRYIIGDFVEGELIVLDPSFGIETAADLAAAFSRSNDVTDGRLVFEYTTQAGFLQIFTEIPLGPENFRLRENVPELISGRFGYDVFAPAASAASSENVVALPPLEPGLRLYIDSTVFLEDTLLLPYTRAEVAIEYAEGSSFTAQVSLPDDIVIETHGIQRFQLEDGVWNMQGDVRVFDGPPPSDPDEEPTFLASFETKDMAYRLYSSAFARTPDEEGWAFWWQQLANGRSFEDAAQAFVASDEFALRYGENPTDEDYITALYRNALGREPDAEGFAFWVDKFERGVRDRTDMLVLFSESDENKAQTAADFIEIVGPRESFGGSSDLVWLSPAADPDEVPSWLT